MVLHRHPKLLEALTTVMVDLDSAEYQLKLTCHEPWLLLRHRPHNHRALHMVCYQHQQAHSLHLQAGATLNHLSNNRIGLKVVDSVLTVDTINRDTRRSNIRLSNLKARLIGCKVCHYFQGNKILDIN